MIYKFEITYNGITTEIDEPVGWTDVEFIKRRDDNFYGVFFEFSSELSFHSKAFNILTNAFETDDIEANVTVTISKKKVSWKAFEIEFEGVVLFDTYKSDDKYFTVTLEKSSILRELKNIIDKPFEIIPNKNINVHSQPLYFESEFQIEGTKTSNQPFLPDLNISSSELETTINGNQGAIFYNGEEETRNIQVHGHVSCTVIEQSAPTIDRGLRMKIGIRAVDGSSETLTTVYDNLNSILIINQPIHDFDFDLSLDVPFDYNIVVQFETSISFPVDYIFENGTFIKTTEIQEGEKDLIIKGVTFYDAFDQICTEYLGANTFTSTALQETNKLNNLLTNGFLLRQLDKPITTDFKTLFNIVKTLFNVGLTIDNNQLVIANYSDIFDTSSPQLITSYSQPKNNIHSKYVFNQIELKYDKYTVSDLAALNGLLEFNTHRIYAIDSRKIKGKKTFNAKVITAGTTIERLIRRRLQDTNSYSEDKSLAVIALNKVDVTTDIYTDINATHPTGTVSERNELLSISSVLEPNRTFNIRLSPRQIIAQHLNDYFFIRNNEFKFITGEGNNDATIQSISENTNIGDNTINYKSPGQVKFTTDEIITSLYIQLGTKTYFINEIKTKINGKSTIDAVQKID